nr:hypothetical protein [Tanacetum cinerariifolium]
MASSSAPQIAYAPMVQQSSEYSPPEAGLVVPVFQKGDDHIDAINHMMSFLTSVVASRGDRILFRLVRQDRLHQDKEEHQANKGSLCVTTAKVRVTCLSSAQNPNQLLTSSNPRQQVTINNGRVTIQPIQGRQSFVSAGSSRPFTSGQEELRANKGLSGVINVKAKVTCPSSAQNQGGSVMPSGSRIKFYWYKLKQMDKFCRRRS